VFRNTWSYRHLVFSLIYRQFRLRYRQSLVGFGWAIVPPLASMGAATLVFGVVLGVSTGKTEYPLFTLVALIPWQLLTNSVNSGVLSVVQNSNMITRVPFPRVVLPLSAIGLALVDFCLAALVFVPFAYAMGEGIPLTVLWLPLLVLIQVIFAAGIVFLASALNVFSRDVKVGVPLAMQLWLFVTPVMYPLSEVPDSLRGFYLANPMTGLIVSFRRVLLHGNAPNFELLLPALLGAGVAFLIGLAYFMATERRFADVI
jgi:lipopolysaccharide transport system permease protein